MSAHSKSPKVEDQPPPPPSIKNGSAVKPIPRPSTLDPAPDRPPLYIGGVYRCVADLNFALQGMRRVDFDYLVAPLCYAPTSQWLGTQAHGLEAIENPTGIVPSSVLDTSSRWCNNVVGQVGPLDWENMKKVRKTIENQVDWAQHLSLPSVILPCPPVAYIAPFAQILSTILQKSQNMQFWVQIPLCFSNEEDDSSGEEDPSADKKGKKDVEAKEPKEACSASVYPSSWHVWNQIRVLCGQSPALSPAIEITPNLPGAEALTVWAGEPVRVGIIPTDSFQTDTEGRPSLSAAHRRVVLDIFRLRGQMIVSGDWQTSGVSYTRYLRELHFHTLSFTYKDHFEEPYYDYLQSPLQPLADNLDCQTYETFEKDPVKYERYEEAIRQALLARDNSRVYVLMVLGAGRGPLVRAAIRAAKHSERKLKIFAVEKNRNAVIILKNLKRMQNWSDEEVTIVDSDMRTWKTDQKADIIVSELLGSFGDNELSPECLDGAQRFLAPDGISIPYAYTSQVEPITSQKLWNAVRSFGAERKHFETDYVAKLHNYAALAPAQDCFTFVHPNPEDPIDNTRYQSLTFVSKSSALLHGLSGYFEARLFGDVLVSINPKTFSAGMISWFPLYFPILEPLRVEAGEKIEVHFWRRVSATKVWYEWCVSTPHGSSSIHNVNGRSHSIGLYLS